MAPIEGTSRIEQRKGAALRGEPRAAWRQKMSDKIYDVPPEWKQRAFVDEAKYEDMYARSIKDPNAFWAEAAKRLHWYRAPTKIKNTTFGPGNVSI
jgi:hypothetical protein